jgi:hypothetical protein
MFSYDFMQNALFISICIAILCPCIGIFIVLKRYSMIGADCRGCRNYHIPQCQRTPAKPGRDYHLPSVRYLTQELCR